MGTFCILRKTFLDRLLLPAELSALAEMLLQWYGRRAGGRADQGEVAIEAEIYALPAAAYPAIQQKLTERVRVAHVDRGHSDGLKLIGIAQNTAEPIDLSLWNAVLAEPSVEEGCVMLRITIREPARSLIGAASVGQQTLVLCGATESGMFLLKALWPVGNHPFVQKLYQFTAWRFEGAFMGAFRTYLTESAEGQAAAASAWRRLGKGSRDLFRGRLEQWTVVCIARFLAEMPDEKNIAGFLRRALTPLVLGLVVAGIPFALHVPPPAATIYVGIILFSLTAWVVLTKAASIRRYRRSRRSGQYDLYSKPVRYRQVDVSNDPTPTLVQASADLEALGAQHIVDLDLDVGDAVAFHGNRVFTVVGATAFVGMLRKTGLLTSFPAKPAIVLSTRFTDGRRHITTTHRHHETQRLEHVSTRCLPEEGNLRDLIDLHCRHVERLIAQGAVALPPPQTPAQAIDEMRRGDEEERQAWQRAPYSWADALRFAFEICPREYLAD
jgi:hypothetical protein